MAFESVRSVSLTPVSSLIPARRFVSVTTNGAIDLTAANADAIGITLEESPNESQVAIPVALLDGAKIEVEANAAITAGAAVAAAGTSGDAGRADDTGAGANVTHLGYALEAASAAGDIITVLTSKRGLSA